MISIIHNGKKTKAPVCWQEVTVEQAQAIARDWDCTDKIKLFNILTDTEYETVKQSTEIGGTFWDIIQFAYFPFSVKNSIVPSVFKINGKIISVPKKVGKLSIGQSIAVRERMEQVQERIKKASEGKEHFKKYTFTEGFYFDEMISFAVAVYLQPLYDESKFDDQRALELERDILKMAITDVYALGFFLLSQQLNYGKKSIRHLLLKIVQRMRSVREYRS